MSQKKEYHTLRSVANFTSGFGWVIVGVVALIGLILGWKIGDSAMYPYFYRLMLGILTGGVVGVLLGIPFVVSGQMVSVFLDQKELLEEIRDSLKKS